MSDELTDLIASMPSTEPAEIAQVIRERFNLFKKPSVWEADPEPAKDQLWRNKGSARLVRITKIDHYYSGYHGSMDVVWEIADDSRGPKTGWVRQQNWRSHFVYVGEAD